MKFRFLVEELLIEASKKDILIQKLGFNEENAELLSSLTGNLAVWMANKIIERIMFVNSSTKEFAVKSINEGGWIKSSRNDINAIMDWIRVGLNGNVNPYKNKSFLELTDEAKKWHESLSGGEGDINYQEDESQIIRDYRKDGIGFYWVDLQTNNSPQECKRMGHCGRTMGNNTIISLRETKRINPEYTINKSHLTAAIGSLDGIVYQLKGPKNSKPKPEYNNYIVDLITNIDHIKGFGSEYESKSDFSLLDLSDDQIKQIYNQKPEIFNTRKLKKKLKELGYDVTGGELPKMEFEWEIEPENIRYYVEDWSIGKTTDSRGNKRDVSFVDKLIKGELFDWEWENFGDDWKTCLEYYVDSSGEEKIREILEKFAEEQNYEISEDDSLQHLIEELDDNYEIRDALERPSRDLGYFDYERKMLEELENALSDYGEVLSLDNNGATIKINLNDWIEKMGLSDDEFDDIMEKCEDDTYCAFNEMLGDYYEKPSIRIDSRWTPDIDNDRYNVELSDALDEVSV